MANNKNNPPIDEGDGLLSYLNNELNKADKYKLEEQMLEDEFLADAAEGLGMVKDKAALAANIAAINAGINSSLGKSGAAASQTGRSFLSVVGNTVAVAATVALLVVAAYFISQYSSDNKASKTLAENKANESQIQHSPPPPPLSDGSTIPAEERADSISIVTESEGTTKGTGGPEKPIYNWAKQNHPVADEDVAVNYSYGDKAVEAPTNIGLAEPTKPDIVLDLNRYGPASNNNFNNNNDIKYVPSLGKEKTKVADKKANKYRAEEPPKDEAPGVYMDGVLIKKEDDSDKPGYYNDNPTRTTVTGQKDANVSDALGKAMTSYKNGDYRGALNELESLLKKDPGNVKALYYSGMAYKYMGKESKALDFYNKVPAGNSYYENAQWETAQLYKSQKKNAQAITALKEVVNVNGPLKLRAEKMLKELGQ